MTEPDSTATALRLVLALPLYQGRWTDRQAGLEQAAEPWRVSPPGWALVAS